jgi:predicted CXXCH cytochrome family protein
MKSWKRLSTLPLLALGLAALSGCVDEKIVFQDRELFEEPLAVAGNFLGYTDHDSKLTVCGNCHISTQGDWEETGHASGWAGLQDSGHAQAFCEGCHTTSEFGNPASTLAGYTATAEERYEDVQCESCHGAGLVHVTDPNDNNVPLAKLNITVGDNPTGCAECHTGTHHGFADEWAQSRHGDASTHQSYRTRDGCSYCHGGEAAIEAWGINTEFVEKGQGEQIGITCAVCHDPHADNNEGQLRFPIDEPDEVANLCMKCHHKRSIPDEGSSSRGPHSPQGPLLLGQIGSVGWTPPNFAYDADAIVGTHGSEANERLCAGCHVNSFEVTDAETGEFVFNATGHLFKAIPCLDAQGVPTGDDSCAMSTTERTFQGCTAAGCHGSASAALSALTVAQARIASLVTELDRLLALVPADQFSSSDAVFTVAEGAEFNAGLGEIESSAVHNPFLTEALLLSSIDIVKSQYGLTQQSAVSMKPMLQAPPSMR